MALIILLPLLTAALTALLGKERSLAVAIAVAGSLIGLLATTWIVLRPPIQTLLSAPEHLIPGMVLGEVQIPLTIALTPSTAVIAATVTAVLAAVQLVAAWYLLNDPRRVAFHATLSLFGAAMLTLVLSRDLVLSVIGWEVMGWCSWLLIGHHSARQAARNAAAKAFLVTRIADVTLVLGAAALIATASSSDYTNLLPLPGGILPTLAMCGIVIGVLGKSAQLPFSDWLPDAMEGPTPASALIHAATMVAAGTMLLAGLGPLLAQATPARTLLGVSVGVTMLLAAVLALGQTDLKRLLAWSTVSQIAVMLAPLAVLSPRADISPARAAALFHLYSHAIFKALLFLTIAWLAAIAGGTSAAALRGSGRAHLLAGFAWGMGLASLVGLPLLVGGLSKEHVLQALLHPDAPSVLSRLLGLALLGTVALTAAYSARVFVIVLGVPTTEKYRAVPPLALWVALGGLTLGSLFGGAILWTGRFPLGGGVSWPLLLLTLLLILLGAWFGGRIANRIPTSWHQAADAGLWVDRGYRGCVTAVVGLARAVERVDLLVLDRPMDRLATGAGSLARSGSRWNATWLPSTLMLAVIGGAVALLLLLAATDGLTGLVDGVLR